MASRREAGLCFNCEEKFTPNHRCKRLFVLLAPINDDDDDRPPENEQELDISLYALTGIQPRTTQTMHLVVDVAGKVLLALIDLGSSHNFINHETATHFGLRTQAHMGLRVIVANGERVPNTGICHTLAIKVAAEDFQVDCYTLPLDGFNVILDV